MILWAEILTKKKRKRYYDELIRAVWHNDADLRKQYLGPKSLTKKKDVIMNLLEVSCTIRPTWKWVVYPKLERGDGWMLDADMKMGCIPQIWTRWWLNARCHVGSNHPRIYNPKCTAPVGHWVIRRFAIFIITFIALTFSGIWSEDWAT